MGEYEKNWQFSENHMDEIKRVLRSLAMHIVNIEIASFEDDVKRSTDLKVRITSGDVAVRVRRAYKAFRDLTIRAKNGNAKTEIHKLREGYADWYLYLWTNEKDVICDWILVDLNVLRASGLLNDDRLITMNRDGYTGFVAYSLAELDKAGALKNSNINGKCYKFI